MSVPFRLIHQFLRQYLVQFLRMSVGISLAAFISPKSFGDLALISFPVTLSWVWVDRGCHYAFLQTKGANLSDVPHLIATIKKRALSVSFILLLMSCWLIYSNALDQMVFTVGYAGSTYLYGAANLLYAQLYKDNRLNLLLLTDAIVQVLCIGVTFLFIWHSYYVEALTSFFILPGILHPLLLLWYTPQSYTPFLSVEEEIRHKSIPLFQSDILAAVIRKLDSIVIGNVLGSHLLGIYNRGFALTHHSSMVIQGVFKPILTSSKTRVKQSYQEVLLCTGSGLFLVLSYSSTYWIPNLWKESWLPLVSLFPWFALIATTQFYVSLRTLSWMIEEYNEQQRNLHLLVLCAMVLSFCGLIWGILPFLISYALLLSVIVFYYERNKRLLSGTRWILCFQWIILLLPFQNVGMGLVLGSFLLLFGLSTSGALILQRRHSL